MIFTGCPIGRILLHFWGRNVMFPDVWFEIWISVSESDERAIEGGEGSDGMPGIFCVLVKGKEIMRLRIKYNVFLVFGNII
jgi:hypothetical protein